jgi:hypothetical protein
MNTNYFCPSCKGQLNVDDKIVLIARDFSNKQGLIFFHTALGNYSIRMISSLKIKKGDAVDFFCPYCHANIQYQKDKTHLAKLMQKNEYDKISEIIFSKIYGEKATFQIEDDKVHSFGKQAEHYTDLNGS